MCPASNVFRFTKGSSKETAVPRRTEGVRKCFKCAVFNQCPAHPSFPPGWSLDHWAVPSLEQWFAEPDHTADISPCYYSFCAPILSDRLSMRHGAWDVCADISVLPLPMDKNAWTRRKAGFSDQEQSATVLFSILECRSNINCTHGHQAVNKKENIYRDRKTRQTVRQNLMQAKIYHVWRQIFSEIKDTN